MGPRQKQQDRHQCTTWKCDSISLASAFDCVNWFTIVICFFKPVPSLAGDISYPSAYWAARARQPAIAQMCTHPPPRRRCVCRSRPPRFLPPNWLLTATLQAAFRWNKPLVALYAHPIAKGKVHNTAHMSVAGEVVVFL